MLHSFFCFDFFGVLPVSLFCFFFVSFRCFSNLKRNLHNRRIRIIGGMRPSNGNIRVKRRALEEMRGNSSVLEQMRVMDGVGGSGLLGDSLGWLGLLLGLLEVGREGSHGFSLSSGGGNRRGKRKKKEKKKKEKKKKKKKKEIGLFNSIRKPDARSTETYFKNLLSQSNYWLLFLQRFHRF